MDWLYVHDPYHVNKESPYGVDKLVWLWRKEWEKPQITKMQDVSPEMNIVGLLWAPAVNGYGPPATENYS